MLGTIWDTVMERRVSERGSIIDLHGIRLLADSSLRIGGAAYATQYSLKRIQEGYEHVTVWTTIWNRYMNSFEGSFEQYEKDLALLKMFLA